MGTRMHVGFCAVVVGVLAVLPGLRLAAAEVDVAAVTGCDFSLNVPALSNSLSINFFNSNDQCAVNEGCLISTTGTRTLLRFSTRIDNVGTQDCVVGKIAQATTLQSNRPSLKRCRVSSLQWA